MSHTHDIETISKNISYHKHIRDLEFETRKVFEREASKENIENIVTWLDKTRLDNNKITRSMDSSKHSETYELGSNPDPETPSSFFFKVIVIGLESKEKEVHEEEKAS